MADAGEHTSLGSQNAALLLSQYIPNLDGHKPGTCSDSDMGLVQPLSKPLECALHPAPSPRGYRERTLFSPKGAESSPLDILLFKSSPVPSRFIKMSKSVRAMYILAVPRNGEQREIKAELRPHIFLKATGGG